MKLYKDKEDDYWFYFSDEEFYCVHSNEDGGLQLLKGSDRENTWQRYKQYNNIQECKTPTWNKDILKKLPISAYMRYRKQFK